MLALSAATGDSYHRISATNYEAARPSALATVPGVYVLPLRSLKEPRARGARSLRHANEADSVTLSVRLATLRLLLRSPRVPATFSPRHLLRLALRVASLLASTDSLTHRHRFRFHRTYCTHTIFSPPTTGLRPVPQRKTDGIYSTGHHFKSPPIFPRACQHSLHHHSSYSCSCTATSLASPFSQIPVCWRHFEHLFTIHKSFPRPSPTNYCIHPLHLSSLPA